MLFLCKSNELIEAEVNLKSSLYNIGLMASNTVLTSECKDINEVQLNKGTYDDVDLEVYDKNTTKDDIDNYTFPEVWHKFIVFHANFNNNNLAAGNFDYMISEVSSLIIKRRLSNSIEQYLPIFEKKIYTNTDSNEFNFVFTDYLVKNGCEYEYKLVPILKNGIEGLPIYATYEDESKKTVDFNGLFICEPDSVYYTILETEITAQKNKPSSIITTLGRKYPFVLCSTENNYYTGTAKGLFATPKGNCDWDFEHSWDFREKFNEFLLDGKVKLLKYYDGRMWLVNIYENVTNEREDHDLKIITSFNWAEIGDVTDVYSLYDNGFISYNPYTKTLDISDEYDYSDVVYTAKVANTDGELIESASIKLYDNDGNVISTTTTNKSGQFSFSKLRDGDYFVTIYLTNYIEKTVSLTIDNHKPIGESYIVIDKIQNSSSSSEDNRTYLTSWKVLKSTENNDFEVGDVLTSDELPTSLTNTGATNSFVVLDSDFTVKENDHIFVSIKGTYRNDGASDDILSQAGFSQCSATIYTGVSQNEGEENDYNEIVELPITLVTNTNKTEFYSNISTYSSVSGDLKLMLYAEHFDTPDNNVHSIIKSVSIVVNGVNIFEMG